MNVGAGGRAAGRLRRGALAVGLAAALAALAACEGGGTEPPPVSVQLVAVAADVGGPAGSRLLNVPLAVVRSSAGEVVSGVAVTLSLAAGAPAGFALPETRAASGPDGIVRADLQLGATGQASLRLQAGTDAAAGVTVALVAGAAPAITAVTPATFAAGDELRIAGSGLAGEAAGITVLVGGVRATVLEAGATELVVRAPACVAPGAAQLTVALAGGVTTNALPVTYAAGGAAPSLQPFEAVTVPASRAAECLSLLGGGARYLVVPQYATADDAPAALRGGVRPGYTLSVPPAAGTVAAALAPGASLAAGAGEPVPAQRRLDHTLRLRERELARLAGAAAADEATAAPPLLAQQLGSTRTFQVLADLERSDLFSTVTARLRFVGTNILVYVDQDVPANGLTDAQLDGLGRLFDGKLYPAAVQTFGSESDIDRNERVIVLLTPVVNRMTQAADCETSGFVTGFFYGLDLLPAQRNSNRGEVFYAMVPDPTGSSGSCGQTVQRVLDLVPATFIHELQHMISWNQHVIVRNSAQDEELWLNEGLSHIAEEVASLLYERDPSQPRSSPSQLFPDSAQGFVVGNYQNAYYYLSNTRPTGAAATSLTLALRGGSLEERGAAFLFLRWLGDQKGDGIYRRLVETRLRGTANVADKAGEPFERLFADFMIAAYAADRLPGVVTESVPSRYRFTSRNLRQLFNRLYETNTAGVTRPFPIAPEALGVGSVVNQSMVPGTAAWYTLGTPVGSPRVTVGMTSSAAPFDARLGAQVSILRLP